MCGLPAVWLVSCANCFFFCKSVSLLLSDNIHAGSWWNQEPDWSSRIEFTIVQLSMFYYTAFCVLRVCVVLQKWFIWLLGRATGKPWDYFETLKFSCDRSEVVWKPLWKKVLLFYWKIASLVIGRSVFVPWFPQILPLLYFTIWHFMIMQF